MAGDEERDTHCLHTAIHSVYQLLAFRLNVSLLSLQWARLFLAKLLIVILTVRCASLTYCIAFNTVAAAERLASVCFTEVYKACIVPVTFCCARWTVEQADGM